MPSGEQAAEEPEEQRDDQHVDRHQEGLPAGSHEQEPEGLAEDGTEQGDADHDASRHRPSGHSADPPVEEEEQQGAAAGEAQEQEPVRRVDVEQHLDDGEAAPPEEGAEQEGQVRDQRRGACGYPPLGRRFVRGIGDPFLYEWSTFFFHEASSCGRYGPPAFFVCRSPRRPRARIALTVKLIIM